MLINKNPRKLNIKIIVEKRYDTRIIQGSFFEESRLLRKRRKGRGYPEEKFNPERNLVEEFFFHVTKPISPRFANILEMTSMEE